MDEEYWKRITEMLSQQYQSKQHYWYNFDPADFQSRYDCSGDPLFKQIVIEAMEYFDNTFKVAMASKRARTSLSKDQKERVVGFMKARLEHYKTNGFLMPEEKHV